METGLGQGYLGTVKRKGRKQTNRTYGYRATSRLYIFNPVTQSERFDPAGKFIRRYLPELANVPDRFIHAPWRMNSLEQSACGVLIGRTTPAPLVDHDQARQRTLERYAVVKSPAVP